MMDIAFIKVGICNKYIRQRATRGYTCTRCVCVMCMYGMCVCAVHREFPHYAAHTNTHTDTRFVIYGKVFREHSVQYMRHYVHVVLLFVCLCVCVLLLVTHTHTHMHVYRCTYNLWLLLPTKQMTPLYNLCKEPANITHTHNSDIMLGICTLLLASHHLGPPPPPPPPTTLSSDNIYHKRVPI